jgi:Carbohydrate-selective porin, OprB family/S-layer homology domain
MKSILFKALVVSPAAILALFPSVASANETLNQIDKYSASQGQVTSVSQLKDVQPTDWAFQALQSLVERYGCIAGYPDGTFRGSRAMTRYEFAAGLNSCLDRVNELIASATADLVTKQDLAVLQKLQEEFQAELATLRGRVDALEATTAELKAKQFSTTTKLEGTAVFDLGAANGGNIIVPALDDDGDLQFDDDFNLITEKRGTDDNVTLGGWVGLNLNTSFTGKDLLRTRLLAGNIADYEGRTGARESQLDYTEDTTDGGSSTKFILDELYYSFPVGKARVFVGTKDLLANDIVPTTTNLMADTVSSYFGDNPLSYDFKGGAGLGFNYQATKSVNLALAYLADDATAGKAGSNNGLTGGNSTLFGQLTFTPGTKFSAALTYNHAYVARGSAFGFDSSSNLAGTAIPVIFDSAQTFDAVGVNASYAFSPKFNLSSWAGFGRIKDQGSEIDYKASVFNWAVNLGFPDLFREGNYGGLSIGSAPRVTDAKLKIGGVTLIDGDDDSSVMAQAFYRFKVSDNISIQPGIVYITNPNGDKDNDNVWVTSLRTKFSF